MIAISWNCQVLENRRAVQVLADLVRKKGPKILFLMETKLSVSEMKPIQQELQFDSMTAIPSVRRSGGIALLWKNEVPLTTYTISPNHIDVVITTSMQV